MSTTAEEKEVTEKLFVLLKDDSLVADYISLFGFAINAKNLKEIRDRKRKSETEAIQSMNPALAARAARLNAINESNAAAAAAAAAAAITSGKKAQAKAVEPPPVVEERDPIFETTLICPVCERPDIIGYELRAKSQQVLQTAFLVPMFTGSPGFKTYDYNLIAVTVCPDCLFASPDRKNFIFPALSGSGNENSTLPEGVILDLKGNIGESMELLPAALSNDAYFKRDRTPKVAIESYRLAMARAMVEASLLQPYGYYKMGYYALKIAHIMKANKEDDTEALTEALGHFEKSFGQSECTAGEIEAQVLYIIVVLSIRLDKLKNAHMYLAAFKKLIAERQEQMKREPGLNLNTKSLENWEYRARYMWDDRDNPNFDKLR